MIGKKQKLRCKHNKNKYCCTDPECGGGTRKCKAHGISKGFCKDPCCNSGHFLCALHKIDRRYCKDPRCQGGQRTCQHKVDKAFCSIPECGGGQRLCIHKLDKRYCFLCEGSMICTKCKLNSVRRKGIQCKTCNPSIESRGRYKEARIGAKLRKWADEGLIPHFSTWNKMIPGSSVKICGKVMPDFSFELHDKAIVLEVDEFQHQRGDYNLRCELVRLQDIVNSYGMMPVHIIRYNPDFFKISGRRIYVAGEQRQRILLQRLQDALIEKDCGVHITIEYIFYDCTACADESLCPTHHTMQFATMSDFAAYIRKVTEP